MHHFFTEFRAPIVILAIIFFTIIIGTLFNQASKRYIRKYLLKHNRDITGLQFIRHIFIAIIYIIGFAAALEQVPELRIVGHSLLAGAGVISLIAGLASQQALSNIMSGILIVIFKPFKINDKVTLRGTYTGTVEEINLRQVVLLDSENNRIIVPNSVIGNDLIVNAHFDDPKCCKLIDIGIGYSSDVELALKIMQEEVMKHPLHIDNRTPSEIENNVPEVKAKLISLGDSSVLVRVWAWAKHSSDAFTMNCDLLLSIKKRFDKEGIEIPFPQRTVTLVGK